MSVVLNTGGKPRVFATRMDAMKTYYNELMAEEDDTSFKTLSPEDREAIVAARDDEERLWALFRDRPAYIDTFEQVLAGYEDWNDFEEENDFRLDREEPEVYRPLETFKGTVDYMG